MSPPAPLPVPIPSIMALDVGQRRIGIAVASFAARLPRPLLTLEQSTNTLQALSDLMVREDVRQLVVGLPRGLNGQETEQTAIVRQFVAQLRQHITLPIHFQDEAVTSVSAESELQNRHKPYNKGAIDALAATIILQDFLREHPGERAIE